MNNQVNVKYLNAYGGFCKQKFFNTSGVISHSGLWNACFFAFSKKRRRKEEGSGKP